MGVQKQLIQRMIFNAIDNNRLGITLEPPSKTDIGIVDHTLYCRQIASIPCAQSTAEGMWNHVLMMLTRVYIPLTKDYTIIILCDDGTKGFKPGVRHRRDAMVEPSVYTFMKAQGRHKVVAKLLGHMAVHAPQTAFVHITGVSKVSMSAHIHPASNTQIVDSLQLMAFAASTQQTESDTLMFDIACHIQRTAPFAYTVSIMSRDSDIVVTAMAIVNRHRLLHLGRCTIRLVHPMFTHTKDTAAKDFDQALGVYGWNDKLHNQCQTSQSTAILDDPHKQDFWCILFNCDDLPPHIQSLVTTFTTMEMQTPQSTSTVQKGMAALYAVGVRGPLIRRLCEYVLCGERGELSRLAKALLYDASTNSMPSYIMRKRYLDVLRMAVAVAFTDQHGSITDSAIAHAGKCMKLYSASVIPHGTYGTYLRKLSSYNSVYMTIERSVYTPACIILSGLVGSDYSMPLYRLGGSQALHLLTHTEFAACASVMIDTQPADVTWNQTLYKLLQHVHITLGTRTSINVARHYFQCVYKTLLYTVHTWELKAPLPSTAYGYTIGGNFSCDRPPTTIIKAGLSGRDIASALL